MAAFASIAVCRRAGHLFLVLAPLVLSALFLVGCDDGVSQPRQVDALKADLDEARRRASHLQNSLAAKDKELAVSTQALETARGGMADMEKALEERNAQLRTARTELDEIKKKDAFAFGEIAATQQQGSNALAVTRYQKFIADYPKSPLVVHANNAIAQLTDVQREVRRQVEQMDPARRGKDFAKNFNDGYMTLAELAPYLKKKTLPQVIALLGRPNQTYNEGTEIGYADKAINPVTGTRGMLIVSFDSGAVASLRVEYGGRKMIP